MIQIEETVIRKLILHRVNIDGEKSILSNSLFKNDNEEEDEVLKKIFLKPFLTATTTYEFKHDIDLELNPLYKLATAIYSDENFVAKSKSICQHLKSVSKHPNIKDGDLFVIKYDDIKLNNKFYEALGIYKVENKESYIETFSKSKEEVSMTFKKGIGSKRLDKACLILFTEKPFTLFVIDNNSVETDYWQNEFIKLGLRNDNVNNTTQFLTLTKTFVTQQFPSDFEVTKADQIDLLNRSVEYFKTHESFDKKEFEKEVFQDAGIIKSFRNFDDNYRQDNEIELTDNFDISPQAVKKQARVFKSVLKLDKNFHIYIHGNRDLIEQGVEKDGRKYYKIYFNEES